MEHILLAEDDPLNRLLIAQLVEKAGYRVTSVSNGKEAMKAITLAEKESDTFALLITDLRMPHMNGIELINELKLRKINLPVLALTGYGDKGIIIELMRKGCCDYLEKPVDTDELITSITRILNNLKPSRPKTENGYSVQTQTEFFQSDFDKVRKQIDLATDVYRNLVQIHETGYNVKIACFHRPLFSLGGDFADITNTPKGCDILLADVSGHDMGASYHTVLIKFLFEENKRNGEDGIRFFNRLNKRLIEYAQTERMVTAIFLRIDLENRVGEAVSAGHPSYIKLTKSFETEASPRLKGDILGVFDQVNLESKTFPFSAGDRIFLFTDGIINASRFTTPTGKKEKLTEEGLKQLLVKFGKNDLKTTVDEIGKEISRFGGFIFDDDLLLFGIEIPYT